MDINSDYDKFKKEIKKKRNNERTKKAASSKSGVGINPEISAATEKYIGIMGSVIKNMEVKESDKLTKEEKIQRRREQQRIRKEKLSGLLRLGYSITTAKSIIEDNEQYERLQILLQKDIQPATAYGIVLTVNDDNKLKEILDLISIGINPNTAAGIVKGYSNSQKERFLNMYENGMNIIDCMALSSIEDEKIRNRALDIQKKGLFIYDAAYIALTYDKDDDIDRATELVKNGVKTKDTTYVAKDEHRYNIIKKLCDDNDKTGMNNFINLYKYIDIPTINIPFKDKRSILESIDNILATYTGTNLFEDDELKAIIKLYDNVKKSMTHVITPTKVSSEETRVMMNGFFANNNKSIENIIKNTDFSKFGRNGLPLKYSRLEFINDLNSILDTLPENKRTSILNKLDITLTEDKKGYDGIININKLDTNDEDENSVYKVAYKFIKENEVQTNNKELNNVLNSLIKGMPEFINTIGKKQHQTHDLSLDSHILKVLQEVLKNPNYDKLPNIDKTALKFIVTMHDIAKAEGMIDDEHPEMSALYARDILRKYKLPTAQKDRIIELIKNHHWLAKFNTGRNSVIYTASLFRHNNDYEMSKIMAEADLKGVSEHFYNMYSSALYKTSQYIVESTIKAINATGQMIFTDKIIKPDLIPEVEYNGEKYKVVDFTKINDNTDLTEIGFAPETTKDNLRLFVHMTNPANLDILPSLQDITNEGFLCSSFVSLDNCHTYWDRKFGVSLETEITNIANASSKNQVSGYEKDFSNFSKIITNQYGNEDYRQLISSSIKDNLQLSDEEYIELFKKVSPLKYFSQIRDDKYIKLSDKKNLSGKEIKEAIRLAADKLLQNEQNEVNLYSPKINAVVAKVNTINEIPQEYLNFAQKNHLPIYILGNND